MNEIKQIRTFFLRLCFRWMQSFLNRFPLLITCVGIYILFGNEAETSLLLSRNISNVLLFQL